MNRASFGRRGVTQTAPAPVGSARLAPGPRTLPVRALADPQAPSTHEPPPEDEEFLAWKQQRSFAMPWKQLCLMASICFGLASFVLPADVNAAVNWLLYGLTAMSFWVWFQGRRARANP